jgi:hypothetical protein
LFQSNGGFCNNYNYNNPTTCSQYYQQRCNGNSLYWYDSCGNLQGQSQYCPNGCYNNACQNIVPIVYPVVYNNTYSNAALTATKTARNITTNGAWSSSVYASPSDMVMFMITLQANGTGAQNVFVRDSLPANLIYQNQLVVAGTSNYSGDIMSGINVNTISAGQTVTITYQAQVAPAANFTFGTTTLNNSAYVTSGNAGNQTISASVVVTKAGVLGASTVSTGLTNNFWVDSFFLPLLLVLIGLWMWKSGLFFGIEQWFDRKNKIRRTHKAEKELNMRIANIQKAGR